jgi:YggT family protein
MFVLGNLLSAIATVLHILLTTLMWILIINALLSWVRPDPSNAIVQFLDRVSDLVCDPIRKLFPTMVSGIDFAPFVAVLAVLFVDMFLVGVLRSLALRMG